MMDKINFGYSMKNIGIPHNKTYLLQLIEEIKMVIKRMIWKVLCNGKKETNSIKTEWYDSNLQKHGSKERNLYHLKMILLHLYRTSDLQKLKTISRKKNKKRHSVSQNIS